MKYNEIIENIYSIKGIRAKQREIAEILGMRVNAVGLRASRNSEFSAEDLEKIGQYYDIDLFGGFKSYKNSDETVRKIETAVMNDDHLKKLFNIILLLSKDNRGTVFCLAERLKMLQG